MKTMFKAIAFATVAAGSIAVATPAAAQSRVGVAVADAPTAIEQSTTYKNALRQIQTTYAAQIQQANTREQALVAEIQPLATAYNNAVNAKPQVPATINAAAQALQTKQQAAQRELATIRRPLELAGAYVQSQLTPRLEEATKNVMRSKKVDLILSAQATTYFEPYVDISSDIGAELSRLVPTVSVTPPAGWQPGQQQQAPAAAPAPARPAPRGR